MKVTFLTRYDGGLWFGGAEVQAEYTARELRRLGVEVEVFSPASTGVGDLVHTFGCYAYYYPVALHCRQHCVPYVVSPVFYITVGGVHKAWWKARAITRSTVRVQKRLFRGASFLLPNSETEAGQVADLFAQPMEKMHVTPNGVEERFADASPGLFRSTYGIEEPFVLNVARIEPRKNQLRLIQALKGTGIRLVIMGEPSNADYVKECRSAAGADVTFLAPVKHEDPVLASAYAACRVFALPSLLETPGLASLEAGMAGARVVTTPVGGGREYFADLARYVDPLSVPDIRARVLQAWEAPDPGDALRERLLAGFTWRRVAERTLQAYERALAAQPAGARTA